MNTDDELDKILIDMAHPSRDITTDKHRESARHQAKQAILKNYRHIDDCLEIIKEVNEKLFMYEVLMGKIDYKYEGKDIVKQFIEYQELEPERLKFADWLEGQALNIGDSK